MPVIIDKRPTEEGTLVIVVSFFDEDDLPVSPNSGLVWSLKTSNGVIVNARNNVAISSAESVTIVLTALDLALPDPTDTVRVVSLKGSYNSSLGTNLPIRDQVSFYIQNLV